MLHYCTSIVYWTIDLKQDDLGFKIEKHHAKCTIINVLQIRIIIKRCLFSFSVKIDIYSNKCEE